jgi:hypothetical protein
LKNVDLLVVCTNRITHSDTDHLDRDLPCAFRYLDKDTESAIVEAVLDYFRSLPPVEGEEHS